MPTLLVLTPHPDDESFAFGGLMALAARARWRVVVYAATSGEKGKRHDGGALGLENVGPARESELRESCRVLGAEEPVFWRLPDGGLKSRERELIDMCDAEVRAHRAEVVATLGRDGAYGHPDHIALHRAVETVFGSGGEGSVLLFSVFPKGLFLPQYEKCLAMMGEPPDPPAAAIGGARWDWEVDIRSARSEKLAAIATHRTQLPGGDPRSIFPPGIVDELLEVERYASASPMMAPQRELVDALVREITLRSP